MAKQPPDHREQLAQSLGERGCRAPTEDVLAPTTRPLGDREDAGRDRILVDIRRGIDEIDTGAGRPADEVFAGIRSESGLAPDSDPGRSSAGRRPGPRPTIGRLMVAIAGIALSLAVLPPTIGIPATIFFGGIVGILAVVVAFTDLSSIEAAAWAFAAYPLGAAVALYGTWLVAWASLGHVPLAAVDDPKHINIAVSILHVCTWMFLFGSFPALTACLGTIVIGTAFPESWGGERRARVGIVAGVAFFAWSGVYILLATDPGRVLSWFAD